MSERQATLHDENMRGLAAQVVDLRAQLAALESSNAALQRSADHWQERAQRAEAQLAEKDVALKGLIEHIERLFGDATHPAMATRALLSHARAASLVGKP